MARGATDALSPGGTSRHPQPVLDILPHAKSTAQSPESGSDEDGGLHMPGPNGVRSRPGPPSHALTGVTLNGKEGDGEETACIRHGWETQLQDRERATLLSQNFFMYYEEKRHETAGNPPPEYDPKAIVSDWRMKDRLKTTAAILAVCLNVGVDPPDVIKTDPCAKLECWVNPIPPDTSSNQQSNNSKAQIGKNLQSQYENLSLRSRYRVMLDPTIEELRRYTTSLRRTTHAERILFHYNGHGVPKPTASGEIWCFNRGYTQYIPISLYDIQEWVGAPGVWVWDCSASGGIIKGFLEGVKKHNANQQEALSQHPNRAQQQTPTKWDDCIHLAACRDNEVLPTNPNLPADLFTSCLTTPIAMALRFFILQNPIPSNPAITLDTARAIPGKVSERRTPLGELNWIFTAITDTIAWNIFPPALFKKLFRQDLMIAALSRNFLLAQRVMRMYHCHPQSWPQMPDTHHHALWRSWDLAVELVLNQVPRLIEQQKAEQAVAAETAPLTNGQPNGVTPPDPQPPQSSLELDYVHSDFFADQLSAFEVYLSAAPATSDDAGYAEPPVQLPIVLQVLLSQVHRLRALILLSKFLDLGPWAVNLALRIGIFPYVLKLLQSQAVELKPPMIFIWARMLAVDQSCQADLLRDNGYTYFTSVLNNASGIPQGNIAEHRAMCAFVIAMFCKDFPPGQQAVLESNPEIVECCLQHLLDMENPLLRQWSCLCLGNMWADFQPAKKLGFMCRAHARIRDRSHDPVPEVRAACLDALTNFVRTGTGEAIDTAVLLEEETLASVVIAMGMDGSIMVRKELTIFYSTFIRKYEGRVLVAAWEQLLEERDKRSGKEDSGRDGSQGEGVDLRENGHNVNGHARTNHQRNVSFALTEAATTGSSVSTSRSPSRTLSKKTVYRAVWRQILSMSADPHPEVARNASITSDYIINALLDSPLGEHAHGILDEIVKLGLKRDNNTLNGMDGITRQGSRDVRPQTPPSPTASMASRGGYFELSRTASVTQAVKTWFGGSARTPEPPLPSPIMRSATGNQMPYRSRPLTPRDAAMLPPNALDHFTGPPHQSRAPIPKSPYYIPRDLSQPADIPLKSNFFVWASSYFREPQMRSSETDEPGSIDYNERLWRRNRNDKIIAGTQPLKKAAGSQRWDVPCGYFGIGAAPMEMVFHQFEPHLVTSDDRDSIAVWDWETQKQIGRFSNGNPDGSRVTELRFINEDDQAMLMTGSSDGVIKIFKNYDDAKKVELASSFRALSDLVVSDNQNAGLVFDWQQGQGRVLVAGDDRVVRVWQAAHELFIVDIPARSGSCITSLTSDQVEGNIFIAGFGNGTVRAYDQRMSARDSMIMAWVDQKTDHRSWIVGVHLQRGGMRELISAESNGGVRLWDIRNRKAVHALNPPSQPGVRNAQRQLRTLAVHEHAPVFATGGADHNIRVYNTTELKRLSAMEPYMSLWRTTNTARNAPITATAFHPHRLMMACGAVNDGHVNLFKCEAEKMEKGTLDGGTQGKSSTSMATSSLAKWPPSAGLSTVNVPRKDAILPVFASIRIQAPAHLVFDALLRVSDYEKWNTFCPRATIQTQSQAEGDQGGGQPQSSPPEMLRLGTSFTFYVVMSSAKPESTTETGLRVSDFSTPDHPSTYIPQATLDSDGTYTADLRKVYRIAWKTEGGFVARGLRSERFHEVIAVGADKCEVRTWEVMGGVLAHTVKWMYKQTLMEKFRLWCSDLKKYCEQKS
ncbi:Target of rapamycin complex 1 subunit kog1 [Friedmanniomyces endolithicus]|nr:Target of rapamycin complex 1 subunit kog1 [Friedmanniomyces endolithicus]KAK0306496.1 Target of rapamycin complex 1 subunit kog1 [Friedmanniomyces endolithicus]KAK0824253.1 Target of rapamycin complex 1 subunit kog1 [Friedmanniomyces endolithicus]